MQTIVFNATFNNTTKTYAVVGEESEVYEKLVQQIRSLFGINENIVLEYTNDNGDRVPIHSSYDLMNARQNVHSILSILVGIEQVVHYPVVLQDVEMEDTPQQSTTVVDKKQQKIAKRLAKIKQHSEKKQQMIQRNQQALSTMGIEKLSDDQQLLTREDIKIQIIGLKTRVTQLKIQMKSLPNEKKIETQKQRELKRSEKIALKLQRQQLKLQHKEERLRMKQAKKENRGRLNTQWPGKVKHVYVDGDHLLSKFPFKVLTKKDKYTADQVKDMMLAMNNAFTKHVQSTTPDYHAQVVFAESDKTAVDQMVDIAGALKQLHGLDTCAFICNAQDGNRFVESGAATLCSQAWLNLIFDQLKNNEEAAKKHNIMKWVVQQFHTSN
jgi:hypothetical protein